MGKEEDIGNMARAASEKTLLSDVKRFLKKRSKSSPTDYNKLLKVGTICLKKRTVFPTSAARKLCYKTLFKAFKVKSRVATNSYRCTDLQTDEEIIVPGDNLIKLSKLTEAEAIELCKGMEDVAAKCFVNDQLRVDEEMDASFMRREGAPQQRSARSAANEESRDAPTSNEKRSDDANEDARRSGNAPSRSRNARKQEPTRRSERLRNRQNNRNAGAIYNLSICNIFD